MAWTDYDSPGDLFDGFLCDPYSSGTAETDALSTIGITTAWIAANLPASTGFIVIPVASLSGLTDAEAHASDGDARKLIRALIDQCYTWYNAIPSADRPDQMTISRSGLVGTGDEVTRTWSVQADLDASALEVADE